MRWGKIILIFQAVITLVIGLAFMMQVLELDKRQIAELNIEMDRGIIIGGDDAEIVIVDIKERYTVAAYVLLIISVIELLLVTRLMGGK